MKNKFFSIKKEEFNANFFNKNCRIGTGSSSMSIYENCQRNFSKSADEHPQSFFRRKTKSPTPKSAQLKSKILKSSHVAPQIKISQKLNDFCGNQRSFL